MTVNPNYADFASHPVIQSIAGNARWTISMTRPSPKDDKVLQKKVPTDMYNLIYKKHITGALYNDHLSLVTLPVLNEHFPNAANYAYYLDAAVDKFVVLDIEADCPDDIRQKFLKLPSIYSEVSLSGKGIHLVFPLPRDILVKYPVAQQKPKFQEEHKWYEILLQHYVTFTARQITTEPDPTASFEELFESMAAMQKEVIRADIEVEALDLVENRFTDRLLDLLAYTSTKYGKTPADFHNDLSRYEFGFMAYLNKKLSRLLAVSEVAADHDWTESERAWFIYKVANEKIPPRAKHDEVRDGLPWLLYVAREVIAKENNTVDPQSKKGKKT